MTATRTFQTLVPFLANISNEPKGNDGVSRTNGTGLQMLKGLSQVKCGLR